MTESGNVQENKGIVVMSQGQFTATNVQTGQGNSMTVGSQDLGAAPGPSQPDVAKRLDELIDEVRRHGADIANVAALEREIKELSADVHQPKPDSAGLKARLERIAGMVEGVTAVGAAIEALGRALHLFG